jgi:hypothetical protein
MAVAVAEMQEQNELILAVDDKRVPMAARLMAQATGVEFLKVTRNGDSVIWAPAEWKPENAVKAMNLVNEGKLVPA